MRRRSDWGILAGLFVVLAVATVYFSTADYRRQNSNQPTTYSADKPGTKALYDFFQQTHLYVQRFEQPYTRLPADGGLLVAAEPFAAERDLQQGEQAALTAWIRNGGTLLLIASPDYKNHGIGIDVSETQGADVSRIVPTAHVASPYLEGVRSVWVEGSLRLRPQAPNAQTTLASDGKGGAYIVTYHQGKGVVVVTCGMPVTNVALKQADAANADNGLFYNKVASAATSSGRPLVLFDEYHQGFGLEASAQRSLWDAVGAAWRGAFWYALALFAVLVVSLNRRFGAPIRKGAPSARPSTEYVASVAGFFQRAGAADIALETIYHDFARYLAKQSDAPPDAPSERVAAMAARRFGWPAEPLTALMSRCEQIIEAEGVLPQSQNVTKQANPRRLQGPELVRIAQQLQDYRRRAEIARAA
ncbi:MAG TPA: DUF4350 domain-containing protein [Chloroflexota bacterium]|nr:DUF4350 domain-containing protein [Chloroflexota bacterium]